jgi:hypothetical protein
MSLTVFSLLRLLSFYFSLHNQNLELAVYVDLLWHGSCFLQYIRVAAGIINKHAFD